MLTRISSGLLRIDKARKVHCGAVKHLVVISTVMYQVYQQYLTLELVDRAKNFFGDGIALWITQQGYYMEGTLHGSQEKFTGIGIIFDTFKNTENLAAHRDVTVLVNDGTKTYEMMTETVQGCNMNVRFHNERGDFDAAESMSKAKIILQNNS